MTCCLYDTSPAAGLKSSQFSRKKTSTLRSLSKFQERHPPIFNSAELVAGYGSLFGLAESHPRPYLHDEVSYEGQLLEYRQAWPWSGENYP